MFLLFIILICDSLRVFPQNFSAEWNFNTLHDSDRYLMSDDDSDEGGAPSGGGVCGAGGPGSETTVTTIPGISPGSPSQPPPVPATTPVLSEMGPQMGFGTQQQHPHHHHHHRHHTNATAANGELADDNDEVYPIQALLLWKMPQLACLSRHLSGWLGFAGLMCELFMRSVPRRECIVVSPTSAPPRICQKTDLHLQESVLFRYSQVIRIQNTYI